VLASDRPVGIWRGEVAEGRWTEERILVKAFIKRRRNHRGGNVIGGQEV
jgi:hypothetical protein